MSDPAKAEIIRLDQALPEQGRRVIVVSRQFRALGFRDENGIWREERHPDAELNDVIGWMELGLGNNTPARRIPHRAPHALQKTTTECREISKVGAPALQCPGAAQVL